MQQFLIWCPRIVIICFAAFISLFAADAWNGGGGVGRKVMEFLLHLLPTAITLAFLWVAWKHRMLGGLLFVVWGLVFTIQFHTYRTTPLFLTFSMPLLASGFMLIFSTGFREKAGSPNH